MLDKKNIMEEVRQGDDHQHRVKMLTGELAPRDLEDTFFAQGWFRVPGVERSLIGIHAVPFLSTEALCSHSILLW